MSKPQMVFQDPSDALTQQKSGGFWKNPETSNKFKQKERIARVNEMIQQVLTSDIWSGIPFN